MMATFPFPPPATGTSSSKGGDCADAFAGDGAPVGSKELGKLLDNWVTDHAPGRECFFAPHDVVLSPHIVARPDLVYVSEKQCEIINEANVPGASDLVVEITSPATKQRDHKWKKAL